MAQLLKRTQCLDEALRERDEFTQNHSFRVEYLSHKIGEKCKLNSKELVILRAAAKLHDVGKIGISDNILFKPDKFEPDEWEIMKTHSELGEQICRQVDNKYADNVSEIVRSHHEYFNGGGYPDGLSGEAIPVSSRIISIVDSYDAMSMVRPYHPARTHEQTMEIMQHENHIKFDPKIFTYFQFVIDNR